MKALLGSLVCFVALGVEHADVRIQSASGEAVANAKVLVLLAGESKTPYVRLLNGFPDPRGFFGRQIPKRLMSDENGVCSFQRPERPFVLLVSHPNGVALVEDHELSETGYVTLKPWGRVEGQVFIGSKPYAERLVYVSIHRGGPRTFSIHYHLRVETDSRGRFEFDRVLPGRGSIGRWYVRQSGNRRSEGSESSTPIDVKAGETTRITLGGTGRVVEGRVVLPPAYGDQVDWNRLRGRLYSMDWHGGPPAVPTEVLDRGKEAVKDWFDTYWGSVNRRPRNLRFEMNADGTFRIDDVPPGAYRVRVEYREPRSFEIALAAEHEFDVPFERKAGLATPIGLGELMMDETMDDRAVIRLSDRKPLHIDTELDEVDAFERQTFFYVKDSYLWRLDTSAEGGVKRILTIHDDNSERNSRIGVAKTGNAYVTNGSRIWRVGLDGTSDVVCSIDDMRPMDGNELVTLGTINLYFRPSPDETFLYFEVLEVPEDRQIVGRLHVASRKLQVMNVGWAAAVEVDVTDGIVYSPGEMQIVAKDFDGQSERTFPVTRRYKRLELSPDRRKLLLSMGDLVKQPAIGILDLKSGREELLPVSGSYATWVGDKSVFYVRGERELWRHDIGQVEAVRVMALDGERTLDKGSYAKAPTASQDGTWLAWQWATRDEFGRLRMGTALIDLRNNQYRRLDGWWHNVAWSN